MESLQEIEKVETMTPEQVAKKLGKGVEFVRAGLRQDKFPFGTAVESNSGQWNYLIIKSKFMEYIKWKERKQMKKEDLFYKKVGQATCIVGIALLYVVPILYSIIH